MVKIKGIVFNCTEGQRPCAVPRSSAELTAPRSGLRLLTPT